VSPSGGAGVVDFVHLELDTGQFVHSYVRVTSEREMHDAVLAFVDKHRDSADLVLVEANLGLDHAHILARDVFGRIRKEAARSVHADFVHDNIGQTLVNFAKRAVATDAYVKQ
jgi:hypothetical protein